MSNETSRRVTDNVANGEIIAIRFTNTINGEVDGNTDKFDISFQAYNWVPGGTLSEEHRTLESVTRDYVSIAHNFELSLGEFDGCVYDSFKKKIFLGKVDG